MISENKASKWDFTRVEDLRPYERNAKKHNQAQIDNVAKSISEFGMVQPIVIDRDNNVIIGHCRLLACKKLGLEVVPTVKLEDLSPAEANKLRLLDNKLNESEWDFELLAEDIPEIDFTGYEIDWELPEFTDDVNTGANSKLSDRFLIPPFDVFNARGKEWLDRKSYWRDLIQDKGQARADAGKNLPNYDPKLYGIEFESDKSILDPVLSEIVCRWFAPGIGAKCFDCFAGDTVFGYVSAYLGNEFTGIELRQEQVDFNNNAVDGMTAKYICDDGRNVLKHIKPDTQDLLFSCPPYFDLEVYSDLENDASNQKNYWAFYKILDKAFSDAVKCLKDNRFAVIVVGDVRDKKTGEYYNFPGDIINTFRDNGMILYNNIKLLTPIGTAQIRAGKYMEYRKTAHVYQDILVFYKGNPKEIKNIFGEVEVADVSEDMEQ